MACVRSLWKNASASRSKKVQTFARQLSLRQDGVDQLVEECWLRFGPLPSELPVALRESGRVGPVVVEPKLVHGPAEARATDAAGNAA